MSTSSSKLAGNLAWLSARQVTSRLRYQLRGTVGVPRCNPVNVNIEITNRCSLRCQMCDIWQQPSEDELSIDEWITIIAQLKDWLGTFKLTITGGEPFMKPQLWRLLQYCADVALPVVVVTNGYNLSMKHLHSLTELSLTQVVFSLDSLSSDVHDHIRGIPGAFERTYRAVEFLSGSPNRQFLVGTNTTIMDANVLDLGTIALHLKDLGVDRILFQPVQGGFALHGRANWPFEATVWPSSPERITEGFDGLLDAVSTRAPIAHSVDELNQFREYFMFGPAWCRPGSCTSGVTTLHCNAVGHVRLCVPYVRNIGNLREQSPQVIWNSPQASREREHMATCQQPCLLSCNRRYSISEKLLYAHNWVQRHWNL